MPIFQSCLLLMEVGNTRKNDDYYTKIHVFVYAETHY